MKDIRLLLLFIPVAVAAEFLHRGELVIFVASALAIHSHRRAAGRGDDKPHCARRRY